MKCGIAIKVSEKEKHDREHHAQVCSTGYLLTFVPSHLVAYAFQVECEACGKRVEMVELTSHTEK